MSRLDNPSNQGAGAGAVGQIKEKTQEAKEKLREMGSAASEQLNQIKDSASQYYEQGREKAIELEENLENYVREQPIKSVLIAAGIGLLVGILWRRS